MSGTRGQAPSINLRQTISPSWEWPTIITLSGMAAALLVLADAATPLRPIVVLLFLLICPGMAYVQLLNLSDTLHQIVVALALSLALDLLIAAIVLYSGFWNPRTILWLLILVSQIGVFYRVFLWHVADARLRKDAS